MTWTVIRKDTREVIAIISDKGNVALNGYDIYYNKDNDKNSKIYELGADAKYSWVDDKLIYVGDKLGG